MEYSIKADSENSISKILCKWLDILGTGCNYINIEDYPSGKTPDFFFTAKPHYNEISLMEWYLTIYKYPKWFIILPSNEQMQEVGEWFNKNYVGGNKYDLDYSKVNYIKSAATTKLGLVYGKGRSNSLFWDFQINGLKKDGFIQITYEEFKKYIKKENMKEKKIIGYKAPYSLSSDSGIPFAEKGEIFTKSHHVYKPANSNYSIPKEIVETWEPVYESTEKELILKSGKKLIIKPEGVDTGNRIIEVHQLGNLVGETSFHEIISTSVSNFTVVVIDRIFKIGCVEVLQSEIREIIKIHNSL